MRKCISLHADRSQIEVAMAICRVMFRVRITSIYLAQLWSPFHFLWTHHEYSIARLSLSGALPLLILHSLSRADLCGTIPSRITEKISDFVCSDERSCKTRRVLGYRVLFYCRTRGANIVEMCAMGSLRNAWTSLVEGWSRSLHFALSLVFSDIQ